jgi:lipopolysaccharide export system protein LptA
MMRTAVALSGLIFAVAWGAPVAAQLAPSSNAPIDVTADQLEVQAKSCLAIWRGHAEALQSTSRLRADTLNLYSKIGPARAQPAPATGAAGPSSNCGALDKMEADGSVYYATPQEVVKGDHAVYLADAKTITVTGDVVISQGKNVVVGNRLVINTDTGQATMESDVKGRGQPGRVRMVFYPNSNDSGGLFPTSPAKR